MAIARALLREAQLLLLDDALSAVDTGTEARILGHLREVRGGRTAIIVSHRLSAVMDAQEIIVLKEGRIAERGTHDALRRGGRLVCRAVALPAARSEPGGGMSRRRAARRTVA